MISPFLVQQNYEGQIDQIFGIQSGYTGVPNKIINPIETERDNKDPEANFELRLTNESDNIFAEIRDMNFNQLGSRTSLRLQEI